MKPIFLVGMPAVGKTTIGRELAKALGVPFVDTDVFIERRYHSDVSDMIACCGIEKFRKREKVALLELSCHHDVVIATGGGMACYDDNMATMTSRGITIYLTSSIEILSQRLYTYRESRPAVAHLDQEGVRQYIEATLPLRQHYYQQAHFTLNVNRLDTPQEVAEAVTAITDWLAQYPK